MKVSFDPKKDAKNIAERGLSFDRVIDMQLDESTTRRDERWDYGETRLRVFGRLDGRLHALVYMPIAADSIRVISLRRANKREVKRYGNKTQSES